MARMWQGEVRGQGGPTTRLADGRPALLFGGLAPAAYRRAAERGHGWVAPLFDQQTLEAGAEAVRARWAAAGRLGQPRIATGRYFSLGPSANDVADSYIRHYYGDAYFEFARADTLTSADRIALEIKRLANAGVSDLVLYPCSAENDQIDRLHESLGGRCLVSDLSKTRPSACV